MNDNEYECAMCHEVFTKARSDEEARDEYKNIFESDYGRFEDTAVEVVCDDCWQAIKPE